jgi:hypothetical protein
VKTKRFLKLQVLWYSVFVRIFLFAEVAALSSHLRIVRTLRTGNLFHAMTFLVSTFRPIIFHSESVLLNIQRVHLQSKYDLEQPDVCSRRSTTILSQPTRKILPISIAGTFLLTMAYSDQFRLSKTLSWGLFYIINLSF